MSRVTLVEGDISLQDVDAVINAANASLLLGSGVAGALRQRAGLSLQAQCDAVGPIEVGRAVVTGSGELPASHVIHAAVMDVPGGEARETDVRSGLGHALQLAEEGGCRVVACPALGTGVGGLGMQRCAEISLEVAREHLERAAVLDEVRFVLLGEPALRVFEMVNDAVRVAWQMARLKGR